MSRANRERGVSRNKQRLRSGLVEEATIADEGVVSNRRDQRQQSKGIQGLPSKSSQSGIEIRHRATPTNAAKPPGPVHACDASIWTRGGRRLRAAHRSRDGARGPCCACEGAMSEPGAVGAGFERSEPACALPATDLRYYRFNRTVRLIDCIFGAPQHTQRERKRG